MAKLNFCLVCLNVIILLYKISFLLLLFQDAGNVMIKFVKREVLENICLEQAAKIEQLNELVLRIFWPP